MTPEQYKKIRDAKIAKSKHKHEQAVIDGNVVNKDKENYRTVSDETKRNKQD